MSLEEVVKESRKKKLLYTIESITILMLMIVSRMVCDINSIREKKI